MSFCVVIPARYAATRLPGKPLLDIAGKPMIQHVHERAQESGAESVIIATDDSRVQVAAEGFGARVCMTSSEHRSGTDRLAEVVDQLGLDDGRVVVNLQGDEPLMPPAVIHQVADNLTLHPVAGMATVCCRITTAAELFDPHVVKVVMDAKGMAVYFSRAAIPWDRDAFASTTETLPVRSAHYRHIGLYAYRAGFLRQYVDWPSCHLEDMESLEQLRALWHGQRIHVAEAVETPPAGVDTVRDLEIVRARLGASS
ncbi:MAG TPA: 3-deoxy-manno-octulosonate cytidylyltransferase [Gammaproteobacteria bacterium]|nr:3-deoxy-manno-octulosonate cytidylyltransferase [Gammaproteobacteria bacterium]